LCHFSGRKSIRNHQDGGWRKEKGARGKANGAPPPARCATSAGGGQARLSSFG